MILQGLAIGAIVGVCVTLSLAAMEYSSLSVTQYSVFLFAVAFWLFGAVVLSLVPLFFFQRTRRPAIHILSAAIGMLVIISGAIVPASDYAHQLAIRSLLSHAQPTIEALKSFQKITGHPASALGQLVPDFLADSPTPAYRVCDQRYRLIAPGSGIIETSPTSEQKDSPAWEYSIECPGDWLFSREALVYRSDGNYEKTLDLVTGQRIGDWMSYYFQD
jgi:hypothetical protein